MVLESSEPFADPSHDGKAHSEYVALEPVLGSRFHFECHFMIAGKANPSAIESIRKNANVNIDAVAPATAANPRTYALAFNICDAKGHECR